VSAIVIRNPKQKTQTSSPASSLPATSIMHALDISQLFCKIGGLHWLLHGADGFATWAFARGYRPPRLMRACAVGTSFYRSPPRHLSLLQPDGDYVLYQAALPLIDGSS
jgi:hypothetical protein